MVPPISQLLLSASLLSVLCGPQVLFRVRQPTWPVDRWSLVDGSLVRLTCSRVVYYKAIEKLLSADGTTVWLPEFDIAGGTNQVTAGQQQSTLPTRERVCANGALAEAFVQFLLHAPILFLQVLANGMVAAFDQQLHLPCTPGHSSFILTRDSLLPVLSTCLTDAPAGCLSTL